MRLLKPSWVSHDGKPIFSIDIHPDGSRFATGGQGDNAGRVVVWNMAPVKDESFEEDKKVPKLLCQMDNHLACVNSVRWSNNGKYLASGGDDKLIMIWQTSRYSGASSVFGSEGKLVNLEPWRCVNTLTGHSGDVLDVAWSPQDLWLASCSIDNTIVVWNAHKFPEQLAVLKGHTGLVKGVTWDPVGKYLASQSDDKTLRVWRTLDWQQEACVTEPFQECGGTTHVLRLGWSPDGHYLVSAHAMNNAGPTAQIIERNGWKVAMDFVGHRKAVTVVRFNPNILTKKIKKTSDKSQQYSCCAIGSRDRSLSIWLTALKRPLVVTHDLFANSILDISWSQTGMELLCCSWDGTVAYLDFGIDELGTPLTLEEKHQLHQHIYGKSLAISNASLPSSQIIETTAMLKLQQDRENNTQAKQKTPGPVVNGNGNPGSGRPSSPPMAGPSNSANSSSSIISSPTHKQIETKTKDGRRRITPIFLAPQPDLGEVPLPFSVPLSSGNSNSMFTTTTEQSKIVVEKSDTTAPTDLGTSKIMSPTSASKETAKPSTPVFETAPIQPMTKMAALESKTGDVSKSVTPTSSIDKSGEKEKPKLSVKRKLEPEPLPPPPPVATPVPAPISVSTPTSQPPVKKKDGRGRPRKYPLPEQARPQPPPQVPVVIEKPAQIVYASSGLNLPVPSIDKSISIQISGSIGSDAAWVVEVENSISPSLHQVRCMQGGSLVWDSLLSNKIIAVAGNSHVVCTACEDNSVNLMSATSGRWLLPSLILDSKVSTLRCSGFFIMAITSKGQLYVWSIQTMAAVIKNESLVSIISNKSIKLESSLLTEQGLPIVRLSNGRAFTFKVDLGCWVLLSSRDDKVQMCSDHQSSLPPTAETSRHNGPLATLQAHTQKPGRQAAQLFQSNPSLQQPSTLSHLEKQVACSLALQSAQEYHFWLLTYIRYLVSQGQERKLREICDDLLGPLYKSRSQTKWQPTVLSYNKRKLLQEILPVVGSNLSLQRLFTEYQEQLDTLKT